MVLFRDANQALRAAVLRRFAVIRHGGPVLCDRPSPSKVVFDDPKAAAGAAVELARLGNDPQYVYPCLDHWHLTSQKKKEPS